MATLRRILYILDLAQFWLNLGGDVPYKENGKEISLDIIKNKAYDKIKKSIDKEVRKLEDIQPALKLVANHERFMTVIGKIPVKPIFLKDSEFSKDLDKLNL